VQLSGRDEQTVIICDPNPLLFSHNSVQVQSQSKNFFKCKVQVQMKSKVFEKRHVHNKIPHFFSINSIQIRSRILNFEVIYSPVPSEISDLRNY